MKWQVWLHPGLPSIWSVDRDECIAERVFNGHESLIAAAPDLLEACKAALSNLSEVHGKQEQWACEQLRSAIAKAEGT